MSKKAKSFYNWLLDQINRDDIIGDLVSDIKRDRDLISNPDYQRLRDHIGLHQSGWYDVRSIDDELSGNSVSPSVCLDLAKLEYDVYKNKITIKKFGAVDKSGYVYFLYEPNSPNEVKIGRAKNVERRIVQLSTGRPRDLKLIGKIFSENYFDLEKSIQAKFLDNRIRREWYSIDVGTALKEIEFRNS